MIIVLILILMLDFAGFWRSLRESLAKKNWNIDNYNMETYVKVKKNTVFQTYMVLYDTKYMPQFNDLNNSATLKISNDLMLLVSSKKVNQTLDMAELGETTFSDPTHAKKSFWRVLLSYSGPWILRRPFNFVCNC